MPSSDNAQRMTMPLAIMAMFFRFGGLVTKRAISTRKAYMDGIHQLPK